VGEFGEWLGVAGGGRRTKSYWWSGGFAAARRARPDAVGAPSNFCGSPKWSTEAARQRMRVTFLTHYFPPEVGAPQTRIDLLARTLAARGLRVTVHTGFPHYPDGVIPAPYRNRLWCREYRDGIEIVRSAVYAAANRGFARRLADHTAFALSALATAPFVPASDVVVGETPPLFTAAAGAVYARSKRAAYVLNVADLWPASAVELGALRNRRAIAAAVALERWTYAHSDVIVAPTDGIVTKLAAVEEAAGKARRLWPVVDVDRFDPTPTEAAARSRPLRLLFAGTVGLAHGLEVLVEASRLAGPDVVATTIAGDGAEGGQILAEIRAGNVDNVTMLGSVPAERIPGLYAGHDAGAVLLRDLELFKGALPTKLLETMAAGRAVLLAARGESAQLVGDAGAGIVVAPGDPQALADACRRLHADRTLTARLGQAGRSYAEEHFGAQRAAAAWEAQISGAARDRRGRRSPA
jgi:glycosyltransferase involved in cell wall biosynthesis